MRGRLFIGGGCLCICPGCVLFPKSFVPTFVLIVKFVDWIAFVFAWVALQQLVNVSKIKEKKDL